MQPLLAIARLTFKAAFRYRLVMVLACLLIGSVLVLPLVIKHDGTARGFAQILLTYSLGVVTVLLGFATLWLGCGTLANEVEECQLQMVAVKPVGRWQIWLGKWLGIMGLNALLLGVATAAIYVLMQYKASQLVPEQQRILRNEVLVARASARQAVPDLDAEVERLLQVRLKDDTVAAMDRQFVRNQIREQLKAQMQLVPGGRGRAWRINLGRSRESLGDRPLFFRVKFFTAQNSMSGTYDGYWEFGPPDSNRIFRQQLKLASESPTEFAIPAGVLDDQGVLYVRYANLEETALLFPLEDGLEVLYHEGGFTLNYIRGVVIIFCWLGLLAALGLTAATFLSFPVAAFLALGLLMVFFSSGTLSQVVQEGGISGVNHDTGIIDNPLWIDRIVVPLFQGTLDLINLVRGYSPIDLLSTGRSITWGSLGLAVAEVVFLFGGCLAAIGIAIFNRRELAAVQGPQ